MLQLNTWPEPFLPVHGDGEVITVGDKTDIEAGLSPLVDEIITVLATYSYLTLRQSKNRLSTTNSPSIVATSHLSCEAKTHKDNRGELKLTILNPSIKASQNFLF